VTIRRTQLNPGPVTARIYSTDNQVSGSDGLDVVLAGTDFNHGMTIVTSGSRGIQVPVNGVYLANAVMKIGGNANANIRIIIIKVNGAAVREFAVMSAVSTELRHSGSDVLDLNAGDVVSLMEYHFGVDDVTVGGSANPKDTGLSVTLLGRT
jgi:hypothetical protein